MTPAGQPDGVPAGAPGWRQLFDDWIRALTILSEPSREPGDVPKHLEQLKEQIAMVAAVNQPGKISITLRGPVTEHDQQVLAEGLAAMNTIRSRQAWINQVIESQLIAWLAEATGHTRADIIQRLAIELGSVIPPDTPN